MFAMQHNYKFVYLVSTIVLYNVMTGLASAGNDMRSSFPETLAKRTAEISLQGKTTQQSSTLDGENGDSSNAVDGNTEGSWPAGHSCSHTNWESVSAWWKVDMGEPKCVGRVEIYNRDDCCKERLNGAIIRVGDNADYTQNAQCGVVTEAMVNANQKIEVSCDGPLQGRYLSVNLDGYNSLLQLCEVKAFAGNCGQGGQDECTSYHTNNFGNVRVQNSHFEYPFEKITDGVTRFTVSIRGNNDAYIALSPTQSAQPNDQNGAAGTPKIIIGGWNNMKSAVICNSNDDWTRSDSPNILSQSEFKDFYVDFADGHVKIGVVGEEPFLNQAMSCLTDDVKYFGVATGWGGNADWKFCGTPVTCPPGWVNFGSSCYIKDGNGPISYSAAQTACEGQGANMASIHSAEEQEFLNNLVNADNEFIWIGLNDVAQEGNLQWEDGTQATYTNWAPGQPDNWGNNEDCMHFRKGSEVGLWNDLPCSSTLPTAYICKKLGSF